MPKEIADTDEYREATFTRVDLSRAVMRDVDLTDARIIDAVLVNTDVSGLITGLRVNDVEVAPLVEAELDRRHPERLHLRGTDPQGLRDGWATVAAFWQPTFDLARELPETDRQRRVDGEWSLVETLRHLIFVVDSWFGRAVLGEEHPYHPLGLTPSFLSDPTHLGIDLAATASFDEVLAVRRQRADKVAEYLATVTDHELLEQRRDIDDGGYPPPSEHTVLECLHVVMDEEWCHHRYAVRDLAAITGT